MTCNLCNDTGEQRYWEGRWRDEKADNARLRAALTAVADSNEDHWEFRNGAVVSRWRLIARDALNQQPASSSLAPKDKP